MTNKEVKLSQPLDQVAEVKKALRALWRADDLCEEAAVRIFAVFRELKFAKNLGPDDPTVQRLDEAHDKLGDVRPNLDIAAHDLAKLLQRAGFTVPNR